MEKILEGIRTVVPTAEGGGQGRGMSNQNSEPDEELQAILYEVQDKYQLLIFTDPDTGFEMQYELFVGKTMTLLISIP